MKTVLVIGSNGFIGKALLERLKGHKVNIRALQRRETQERTGIETIVVPDFQSHSNWKNVFGGVDCVIHVAGAVSGKNLSEINESLTDSLARRADLYGVRRFIFLSSLSVNGDRPNGTVLEPDSPIQCKNDYAKSKYGGERALKSVSESSNMECIIIRPPMIVGEGAKGSFYRMACLISKVGMSPFGCFKSPYPIVKIGTLCKVLCNLACADVAVKVGVYMPQETSVYSLPKILNLMSEVNKAKTPKHLPVPAWLVVLIMRVLGRGEEFKRFTNSLRIHDPKAI